MSGPLERYLERFLGDPESARDVLQETLLRISRGLPRFRGDASLRTWAFRIATHTAIEHLRRERRSLPVVAVDDPDELPGRVEDTGERLIIEEMNACIREEIDSLPGDYRAAILLHDLEGLTAAETAEICGCSVATAKIRIHRARARLRKVLEEDCTFYHDGERVLRCDRKPPAGEPDESGRAGRS